LLIRGERQGVAGAGVAGVLVACHPVKLDTNGDIALIDGGCSKYCYIDGKSGTGCGDISVTSGLEYWVAVTG
jgi:hypothetical protein